MQPGHFYSQRPFSLQPELGVQLLLPCCFQTMTTEHHFRSEKICNLCHFPHDTTGTIVNIIADLELQGRLMGMGLFVGTRFQLLRNGNRYSNVPFILAVGETRIAIDYQIAEMILVER